MILCGKVQVTLFFNALDDTISPCITHPVTHHTLSFHSIIHSHHTFITHFTTTDQTFLRIDGYRYLKSLLDEGSVVALGRSEIRAIEKPVPMNSMGGNTPHGQLFPLVFITGNISFHSIPSRYDPFTLTTYLAIHLLSNY